MAAAALFVTSLVDDAVGQRRACHYISQWRRFDCYTSDVNCKGDISHIHSSRHDTSFFAAVWQWRPAYLASRNHRLGNPLEVPLGAPLGARTVQK